MADLAHIRGSEMEYATKKRVLVLGNVRPEGLQILESFADVTVLPEPVAADDILANIADMDAMLHKVGKIDPRIIARQSRLRIIARHGIGLDDLDLDCIRAAGIPVSTTQSANSNAVAEATVGLALNLLRNFQRADAMIKRNRVWARESLMGREIASSTVGIVGLGRIGRLVAERFATFGARIVFHDRFMDSCDSVPYQALELDELLGSADIISLHCPLTAENRHLINENRLGLMQAHAILINTARGGLIDLAALASAVNSGSIASAALDVFDREPPDFDDPVFSCPNILTTPHIAAMTLDAQVAMAKSAATEIRRVLQEGLQPTNVVG